MPGLRRHFYFFGLFADHPGHIGFFFNSSFFGNIGFFVHSSNIGNIGDPENSGNIGDIGDSSRNLYINIGSYTI